MARLPGTIDVGEPRGSRLSGATVRPTDFGLSDLGAGIEAVGEVMAKRDDQAADKIIRASQGAFETRFAEQAAGYDGRESGFANKAMASFDNHFTAVAEDTTYSEGTRAALRRRLDTYKADFGRRAINVEAERRAGIVAEQAKVKEEVALGEQVVGFNSKFAARYQARVDGFDGSDPNYAQGVLADFDEEAAAALEAAPENLKTTLQSRLAARRVQAHANALDTQDKGHEAFVAKNAETTINVLSNTVLSNPAGYDGAVAEVDTAAAGVPASLRQAFVRGAQAEIAAARIEGLIRRDDVATAKAELDDGRYDRVLEPAKKAALLARAEAASQSGPRSLEDWRAAYEADAALDSEVAARARGETTGFTLQAIAGAFSPREVAAAERKLEQADRVFAATGNLQGQTSDALRSRAMAPPPDATDPDYGEKLDAWELSRKAAAEELAARDKDPAAWAMTSSRAGDPQSKVGEALKGYLEAPDEAAQLKGAKTYAGYALGMQQQAGVAPAAQRVFPKDQVAAMARSYAAAPPEARPEALQALTATWMALPSAMKMQDGRMVNPRAMAARELRAAGLGKADISAMTDLADTPGRLKLYAEATANPAALVELTGKGREAAVRSEVETRLARFFQTANALPGSIEQNDARMARAKITARHLVLAKGLTPREAAEQATADLVDEYRFIDTWRMPKTVSEAPAGMGGQKWMSVRRGAGQALADLTADGGILLSPAPGRPGMTEAQRRASAADITLNKGRWVTTEADDGLQLMVPTERGWTAKTDTYGRPVRLSWDKLADIGSGATGRKRGHWMAPAPAATTPPKAPPAKARAAFTAAIEHRESGGDTQAVSVKGALGARQLMIGTAKWQASMDRNPVFNGKTDAQVKQMLLADPALNRALSDRHIEFLSRKYDGNVGLMAAAYNAGPGAVDDWLAKYGDPRRGRVSLDRWVADIPYGETRAYVRAVLPRALKNLQRG